MARGGKYWLTPDKGTIALTGSDHDFIATLEIVGLERGEPGSLQFRKRKNQQITQAQADEALARGADPDAIEFLLRGGDPRLWMVREHGWIRIQHPFMEVWRFDDATLNTFRQNLDYLKYAKGMPEDVLQVQETSTGDFFPVPFRFLTNISAEPDAMKRTGLGVGRFRNPEPDTPNETKIAFALYCAGYPVRQLSVLGEDSVRITLRDGETNVYPFPLNWRDYGFADWRNWAATMLYG